MITQNNIDNLYRIASNLSMKDYLRMNPKKRSVSGYPKHVPYSLSDETREATELLKAAQKQEISINEEEQTKTYLLKIKLVQPELLNENSNFIKWKEASGR